MAGSLAVDGARSARKVGLNDVLHRLVPTHETGVGMCSTPDAHDWRIDQRSQVHVGRVHRQHHIKLTHQHQFIVEAFKFAGGVGATSIAGSPFIKLDFLCLSTTEEEDADVVSQP